VADSVGTEPRTHVYSVCNILSTAYIYIA